MKIRDAVGWTLLVCIFPIAFEAGLRGWSPLVPIAAVFMVGALLSETYGPAIVWLYSRDDRPEVPSIPQQTNDFAVSVIDELKADRDRWVELAATNRRTAERVTAERDAAWAEIERLKDELNRLSRGWVGGVIENFNEDNR